MIIGKRLVLLGRVIVIEWTAKDGDAWKADFDRDNLALLTNATGTALFMVPWKKSKSVNMPKWKKEKKQFETWSELEADSGFQATIPRDTLFVCGTITSIIYESDKWTGRKELYEHAYEKPVKFYEDRKKNPVAFGALHERGKKLVSSRGLIG